MEHVLTAARDMAEVADGMDTGGVWSNFTCPEIDAFARLMVAVGRADVAASVVVLHSEVDERGDCHRKIGKAYRRDERGVEWRERKAYRLAAAYVAGL